MRDRPENEFMQGRGCHAGVCQQGAGGTEWRRAGPHQPVPSLGNRLSAVSFCPVFVPGFSLRIRAMCACRTGRCDRYARSSISLTGAVDPEQTIANTPLSGHSTSLADRGGMRKLGWTCNHSHHRGCQHTTGLSSGLRYCPNR